MLGVVSLRAAFVNLDPAHPPAWRPDLLGRAHPDHLVVEEGSEALRRKEVQIATGVSTTT